METRLEELFEGVYSLDGRLMTENLDRGKKVYGEDIIREGKMELRSWTPYRSKLSAAIKNGLKNMEIRKGSTVLYLGAANGTTSSHVSDIVGGEGRVYCIEISERSMRDLIELCKRRENMLPILADAHDTDRYAEVVEKCDVIYQDVSAREQAEILKKNSIFLKKRGYAYFIIKSQSVDISKDPSTVFRAELKKLEDIFDVEETVSLEPYDSAHLFAVMRKK